MAEDNVSTSLASLEIDQLSGWGLGTHLGAADRETDSLVETAVFQAVRGGVSMLDTANIYRAGQAEVAIGRALQRLEKISIPRTQVFLCTKIGQFLTPLDSPISSEDLAREQIIYQRRATIDEIIQPFQHCLTPAWLHESVKQSLWRLGTNYIDLLYLHCPEVQRDGCDEAEFYRRLTGAFEALEKMCSEGQIRQYGIATMEGLLVPKEHPRHMCLERTYKCALDVAGQDHRFTAVQAPCNLLFPDLLVANTQTIKGRLLTGGSAIRELGLKAICSLPLGGGQLSTRIDEALNFIESSEIFDCILVGAKSQQNIKSLISLVQSKRGPGNTSGAEQIIFDHQDQSASQDSGPEIVTTTPQFFGYVDFVDVDQIEGWSYWSTGNGDVRILAGDSPSQPAVQGLPRPDVFNVSSEEAIADTLGCGFAFRPTEISDSCDASITPITIEFISPEGVVKRSPTYSIPLGVRDLVGENRTTYRRRALENFPAAIPPLVLQTLEQLRGEEIYRFANWSVEESKELCADLRYLLRRGSQNLHDIRSYLIKLSFLQNHYSTIYRWFPKRNLAKTANAKDAISLGSTPGEMLTLANHLMVLRSYGVPGDFLEFGCFYGFSTACLSTVCNMLGMRMEVFDSFAGLPPLQTEVDRYDDKEFYGAGDYAADINAVRANVETYGSPQAVTYNKGYFADSLKKWSPKPVACMWLDVDLPSSTSDTMAILHHLDKRGAVFSNEWWPEDIADGQYVERNMPEPSVLPPILDAMRAQNWEPVGHHLTEMTGALWNKGIGVPVLPTHTVLALAALVSD